MNRFSLCKLLSQHFRKDTVSEELFNFGNDAVPEFSIRQSPLHKDVIFVPHYKVTIISTYNVKLSLYLVVVSMVLVQFYIIPIVDETETLISSTQA